MNTTPANRVALVAIAFLAATLIVLELVWTRIFSAEFFYTFAFLILSLAVMGLGLGGLALRLMPVLNRNAVPGLALTLCGLLALVGPPIVLHMGLDLSRIFSATGMVIRLSAAMLILGASFFCGGVALAGFFKKQHREIPRLYRADLIGAAVGVPLAIFLMNTIGTPRAAYWGVLPVLLAALLVSRSWLRLAPLVVIAGLIALSASGTRWLEPEGEERAPVIYRHWDAMSKIKVFDYGGEARGINVDNVSNTPVLRFDGDWDALRQQPDSLKWDINVGYLISRFESCTFLSLGSGGGSDVVQALDKGATEVHAVEVNPHIVRMMRNGDRSGYVKRDSSVVDSTGRIITMAEYSGRLFRDPRVRLVAEDARTYVRRHPATFDVIFSLSSNTWAALGSGSFALAENYLFTTEAFIDYWDALRDNGFLSMEHQVYMPRLVSQVIAALEARGVENPRDHFAVYKFPGLRRHVLLLSRRPLTDEIRYLAYGPLTADVHETRHLVYPAADSLKDNLISRIVTNGWRAESDSALINLSPCTDNRPFIAQMGRWKNFRMESAKKLSRYAEFSGFPMSWIVLAVIMAVTLLVAIPLNLIPFLSRGPSLKPAAWLYFFLIGAAFMIVEVVLIQRYTLFIGASVYSISTVLLALLLGSGIGSRFAGVVKDRVAFTAIAAWILLEVLVLQKILAGSAGLPILLRAAVSVLLVAPLGFFMGMPFPKGGLRVGSLIDWGFAVNGTASVLGATLAVMVSFEYGFNAALLVAGALYSAALVLLRLSGPVTHEEGSGHSALS